MVCIVSNISKGDKIMNASIIEKEMVQARNDIRNAISIVIDSDKIADLPVEHIDAIFNLLGTASINIGSAMNKLRPNTTYYKDDE